MVGAKIFGGGGHPRTNGGPDCSTVFGFKLGGGAPGGLVPDPQGSALGQYMDVYPCIAPTNKFLATALVILC